MGAKENPPDSFEDEIQPAMDGQVRWLDFIKLRPGLDRYIDNFFYIGQDTNWPRI